MRHVLWPLIILLLGCGGPERNWAYSAVLKINITGVERGDIEARFNSTVFRFYTSTTTFPPPGRVVVSAKPVPGYAPTTKEVTLEVEELKNYEITIPYEQELPDGVEARVSPKIRQEAD